jgi:hypothetical protein
VAALLERANDPRQTDEGDSADPEQTQNGGTPEIVTKEATDGATRVELEGREFGETAGLIVENPDRIVGDEQPAAVVQVALKEQSAAPRPL